MRTKRILVIDHEPAGREALQSILRPNNFEVLEAGDGESGWITFEKEQPEMVILDIQLPQGQGFDLCHKIIQASRLDRIPIVIVTDFGLESDVMLRKLSSLDIDFIFPKPAPAKELLQTVFSLLGAQPEDAALPARAETQEEELEFVPPPAEPPKEATPTPDKVPAPAAFPPPAPAKTQDRGPDFPPRSVELPQKAPEKVPAQAPAPSPASPSSPGQTVFRAAEIVPLQPKPEVAAAHRLVLADDNPVTRQIFHRAFSAEDFEITILTDGREVMSALEKIRPAIVLLDINLPGQNAYELCEKIEISPALKGTALILLKEPYEKVDLEKLRKLSWDDFIQKPIKSLEWIARVKNVLAKKSLTAGP